MDLNTLAAAAIMGIVEGLTEFIPVSSTGHLILAGHLLGFDEPAGHVLEVVIQLGAIFAVCWVYRSRLVETLTGLTSDTRSQRLTVNILLGFAPSAVVGAAAHGFIKSALFSPIVVLWTLVVGGIVMLLIEGFARAADVDALDELPARTALGIGLCQVLALVPGVSRSGATILGGVALGVDRRAATEFSFFLAIPTMAGAAAYDLYRNQAVLVAADILPIAVGLIVSFGVALLVVRWLVGFVGRHGFAAFAWYRIVLGTTGLILLRAIG